jgi:biopolymer transport protein ExbD
MAHIISAGANATNKKNRNVHLDMTPMVDLAFLLVTFFVLATSMKKPSVMEIIYPDESGNPNKVNNTITLLLPDEGHTCIYYLGQWNGKETVLTPTDFSANGLRKVLLTQNSTTRFKLNELLSNFPSERATWNEEQKSLYLTKYKTIMENSDSPTLLIKTTPYTPFRRVVSALDEMNICSIQKRVVQDMSIEERQLFEQQ